MLFLRNRLMGDQQRRWLEILLVLGCCAVGLPVVAADEKLGTAGPPLTYRLDDVSVRVQRHYGHGQAARQLVLGGKGQAILQLGDRKLPFEYAAKDVLNTLNGFYRIHFFEMPAQMRATVSVFLKDDGTVGTQAIKMSDAGSTAVCFSVPGYEKCVQYAGSGPRELDDLVKQLLAEADQRARPTAPGK